jgi:hypothetical protein
MTPSTRQQVRDGFANRYSWLRSGFSVIAGMWIGTRFHHPAIGLYSCIAGFAVLLVIDGSWLLWLVFRFWLVWRKREDREG